MEGVFVQAIAYTRHVPTKPPFVLTCDIGDHFELWQGFNGDYGGYGARRDIPLTALRQPDVFALFVDIFSDPQARNPEKIAARVTREVAADLAELTKTLEGQHDPQEVAHFLMRCILWFYSRSIVPSRNMAIITLQSLKQEAKKFAIEESQHREPSLYGMDNGKSIGTYIEHKFQNHLRSSGYQFQTGNSANGIDMPDIEVDIKVTSIRQPQSSCPFRSARQKVYGLGYHLLIFVYEKSDDQQTQTSVLKIQKTIFIHKDKTADYQLTSSLRSILENNGNLDDVIACLIDKNLPVDEIGAYNLAKEICENHPSQGFLTISNALQWRLQYSRAIELAGKEIGLDYLH